ncbi:MAG: hypothetical protein OEZ23_07140 [Gammaproteobacteria bacterium]|nr:hypothetical protein [Gammaproteobacteria bacterium]
MNEKTKIYFGPPLVRLTENEGNTLEKSGRINRTAERYLEIMRQHGVALTGAEIACLKHISGVGYLTLIDIRELADDVRVSEYAHPELDKEVLIQKLESASLADLIAMVESLDL